jgi:dTDP-4-amino-4,6-dideoxygalactose transaminase
LESDGTPLNNLSAAIQRGLGCVAVVADCAHSLGASRVVSKTGEGNIEKSRRYCGRIAHFSSFSFHAVKNYTTAEGGASTWCLPPSVYNEGVTDAQIYKFYQLLSLHGQNKDALAKTQLGAWEYDIIGTWYKCNMTDVAAAIGLKQMERYPSMLARRKEIITKFDNAFKPLGVKVLNHYSDSHQSSGHLYLTRVPGITPEQRNEIINKMAEEGIACNVHYKPLPMHTAYKKFGFDIKNYPNAYAQFANEISLPLHTCLTDEEIDYIIEKYTKILKEYI